MSAVPARASSPDSCSRVCATAVGVEAVTGDQPQHGAGVHRAGPGGHHQSLQRGEAHRGVDAATAAHGRQGGAGAEVAGDQAAGVADDARRPAGGVGVRQAVEAVAADVEAVPPLGRHRVGGRGGRQGGVEGGVEAGDGRHVGRELGHGVERGQRLGLVQRRQVGERLELGPHVAVDHHRLPVALAAVDDPVPDCVEAPQLLERPTQVVVAQPVDRGQVLGAEHVVVVAHQPQLQARRTRVDHQDPHVVDRPVSSLPPRSSPGPRAGRRPPPGCRPAPRPAWPPWPHERRRRCCPGAGTRSITSITRW